MPRPRKSMARTLLTVRDGFMLHWPRLKRRSGHPLPRGGAGYNVWDNDPLLNTITLGPKIIEAYGVNPDDCQLHKLVPAPEGASPSPHNNLAAHKIYMEIGFDGYRFGHTHDDEEQLLQPTPTRPTPNAQDTDVVIPPVLE